MWNPFKPKPRITRPSMANFARMGGFTIDYEQQRLPDPGAGNYSYETLQLAPYTPIGPGVAVRRHLMETNTPLYVGQSVPLVGLPTTPGQFAHIPLLQNAVVQ